MSQSLSDDLHRRTRADEERSVEAPKLVESAPPSGTPSGLAALLQMSENVMRRIGWLRSSVNHQEGGHRIRAERTMSGTPWWISDDGTVGR